VLFRSYTVDDESLGLDAEYYQTAFFRQVYMVNPLLRWSRKLQENTGTWTDVSCSNGSASKIERVEFPSPGVTYHAPGGETYQNQERYLYTFGAQCP
jgi:hypothetical protein